MENIDDFMQRKFDSDDPAERFPFRDEYWEQAQALIEADEQQRRKKRRFLFWWFSAVLLLGIGAFCLWPAGNEQTPSAISEQVAVGTESSASSSENSASNAATKPASADNNIATGKTPSSDIYAASPVASAVPENTANSSKKPEISTPIPTADRPFTTQKNTTSQLRHQNKKQISSEPSTAQLAHIERAQTDESIDKNTISKDQPTFSNHPNEALKSGENSVGSAANTADISTDQPGVTPADAGVRLTLLQTLELPFPPANLKKKVLAPRKAPANVAAEIKPVRDRHGRWAIAAYATANDAGWGYAAGVEREFNLNEKWSVSAGLTGRFLPIVASSQSEPDSSDNVIIQERYSFGLDRKVYRRTVDGIFNLEMPVGLQWRHGRLGLGAGVTPGVLVTVRNRMVGIQETTLGGTKTIADEKEWGGKTNFRTAYVSTFAAAQWRIWSGLGLTTRVNYRPGSMLKPAEGAVPDKNFWYFDLGLRWQF